MLTQAERDGIKASYLAGLLRASFGAGKGQCQATGSRDGSVVVYLCRDEEQLDGDFKAGTPYLLSVAAWRRMKAEFDAGMPRAPERPRPTGKVIVRARQEAAAQPQEPGQ